MSNSNTIKGHIKLVKPEVFDALKPTKRKQINAQYDEDYIVVYQAYNKSIANFANEHQYFGGDFKYTRMTWIKPNYL